MTTMTAPRKVLTIENVADVLRVNPRTVNRLLERGELQGFRVGRLWRISPEALDAYIHGERREPADG